MSLESITHPQCLLTSITKATGMLKEVDSTVYTTLLTTCFIKIFGYPSAS